MRVTHPSAPWNLAREFDHLIHWHLSSSDVAEAIRRNNAESNPDICHTHDFIDSNETMEHAFQNVFKRPSDPSSDDDARVINRAWQTWKDVYRGGYVYSAFSRTKR